MAKRAKRTTKSYAKKSKKHARKGHGRKALAMHGLMKKVGRKHKRGGRRKSKRSSKR